MRVVICGGGIIGCSTAYHLAKKGVACTVIDRCAIGCGASGKAGGFLAREWCNGTPVGPLAQLSYDMHCQLAEEFKDTDFRRMDTLGMTVREGGKSKHGGQMPSWVDGAVSQPSELGTTVNTAQVHPHKLTTAFFKAASELAGSTFKKAVVEGVEIDGQKVTGVKLDGEVMSADVVVITMGPWSGQAEKWLSVPKIRGHRAHSILVKPSEPVGAQALFLDHINKSGQHSDPEVYPRPDGDVYLCGFGEDVPLPDDPADVIPDQKIGQKLYQVASLVSTKLGEGDFHHTQACFLPMSPDGNPVIGQIPDVEGAYIASGHSCWGILNSPATGAVMAELIVEGKCSLLDISAFDPKRFFRTYGNVSR